MKYADLIDKRKLATKRAVLLFS